MKKLTALFVSILLIFSLAACGDAPSDNDEVKTNPGSDQTSGTENDNSGASGEAEGKTLVV